jgi:hypothetical protein
VGATHSPSGKAKLKLVGNDPGLPCARRISSRSRLGSPLDAAAGKLDPHDMQVEWYGQSAFRLSTGPTTVVIDPFGDVSGLAGRGIQFEYPPIDAVPADLVLVTHEHVDHNGVEVA